MATTGTFFEALVTYYGNLTKEALGAMRQTREELRTGEFDLKKILGRTASFWLDASDGWWNALMVNASAPLPTLFMKIGPGETTATEKVHVCIAEGLEPEMSPLAQIGGTARIPEDAIRLEPTRRGDTLELTLITVKKFRSKNVPNGLYAGIVNVRAKPLALVMVHLV